MKQVMYVSVRRGMHKEEFSKVYNFS